MHKSIFTHFTNYHCVKSARIRSYSGPHFPAFGMNTERYGLSLPIQSECGKIRTRKTRNTDTFHAVYCVTSSAALPILSGIISGFIPVNLKELVNAVALSVFIFISSW